MARRGDPSRNTPDSTSPTGTPWDRAESSAPRCHQELGYARLIPAPRAQLGALSSPRDAFSPRVKEEGCVGWVSLGSKVPPAPSRLGSAGRGFLGSSQAAQLNRCEGKRRVPTTALVSKHGFNSLFIFDSQRLALVSAQGPGSHPVSVALGAVLLAIAGLAVDLLSMHGNGGAVQVLLTDH